MNKHLYFWNYILIAIIGGCIGLQNFYTKEYLKGILSVVFCWTCIPYVVSFLKIIIWLFRGEDEFNKKFNIPNNY